MFHRRSLLQGGAAALLSAPLAGRLSAPALAQDSRAATLRFVPQANLSALDPIWDHRDGHRQPWLLRLRHALWRGRARPAAAADGGRP